MWGAQAWATLLLPRVLLIQWLGAYGGYHSRLAWEGPSLVTHGPHTVKVLKNERKVPWKEERLPPSRLWYGDVSLIYRLTRVYTHTHTLMHVLTRTQK